MEILLQPQPSKTCGQHCVAMIAGITADESIAVFQSSKGTHTREVVNALCRLNIKIGNTKLTRVSKTKPIPNVCIMHVKNEEINHWVVYTYGFIYCPTHGIFEFSEYLQLTSVKACSYLEIIEN